MFARLMEYQLNYRATQRCSVFLHLTGNFIFFQLSPRLFQNLPSSLKISQVACGERHTLFALEDGSVAACGQNDYGQVGTGSNENAVVPHFVECVDHVSKVTCGANHNLALTGDGRLFQWGCGRACGNLKGNILLPEEVTRPSSPVRDIAGGCWHSLLLTDGGNVFSWGMGQEGQLGLGEDRIHSSAPRLLSYSQLGKVTQIQAGDSYSAAVTGSGEENRECAHPETEARFRDLVSNPLPTERAEKENTVQVHHQLCHGPERAEGSEELEKDEESQRESSAGPLPALCPGYCQHDKLIAEFQPRLERRGLHFRVN
ncbi:E3 ISG15--protein ligase Herc6-like [Chaetodon auriga]|uniref:E3 ISG15--protein ligase Herc6-like n=1 Tax=Chaetodon auriga TaxID=39042 RepID=UPI0040331436